MVRLAGTISQLSNRKIMVIGDLMLDTYTIGKAKRISPEAPVAIIQVLREENRPGGAGNVILNLISLGASVVAVGRIGQDFAGDSLKKALQAENVDTRGLFTQSGFETPLKNRVIAENQQIVRVDYEKISPLPEMLEQQVINALGELMEGVSAIAISDYDKGFLSRTLLFAIYEKAKENNVPVITDPKGVDFKKYSGTTVLKPNLSEAYAAAGLTPGTNLDLAAERILETANAEMLLITRSEDGISIFQRHGRRLDFPVTVKEIKDVTGAGDTVLAMLTYAIANQLSIEESAQLSNVAAGIAIERFGCARVTLSELARRLLETDVVNKVFDEEHLFALVEALKGRDYTLLGLSGIDGMTSSIFSGIHRLAKNSNRDLVVYLVDSNPDEDFVNLLSALHDIKFILIHSDNLTSLCDTIEPAEIFGVVNKKLTPFSSASELIAVRPFV
jgi:rfaE bifunctional protein kinase chain/domain